MCLSYIDFDSDKWLSQQEHGDVVGTSLAVSMDIRPLGEGDGLTQDEGLRGSFPKGGGEL